MNQPDLFGLTWISAKESLPAPGQRVLLIRQCSLYRGQIMEVSTPVNDCNGNRDNPYYGRVVRGFLYWAEQPLAPVKLVR